MSVAPTTVKFPIQPHEKNGTPITEAHDLEVRIKGPQEVKGEITYKNVQPFVGFVTNTVGEYTVALYYNGKEIQNSPIKVNVAPKKGDEQPQLAPVPAPARYPVRFEVDARDETGKIIPASGLIQCDVAGPEPVQLNIQRSGEKIYLSFETVFLTGTFKIGVLYNERHIQRSPFEINLSEKSKDSVVEDIVKLPPLPEERTIQFKVPARLPDGKAVKGHECAVKVDGPSRAVTTKITEDGENFIIGFDVSKSGTYSISVTKNGQEIDDSPFDVDVPPEAFK